MNVQEQIKQIAEEAKAKIDALADAAIKSGKSESVEDLRRWVPMTAGLSWLTSLTINGGGNP